MSDIKDNDYNLNISRYVNLSKEEDIIDLIDVNKKLKAIDMDIEQARCEHNKFLQELGLPEI